MIRKLISLFTLLTFTIFCFSCYTIKTTGLIDVAGSKERVKFKILSVVKTSGELIVFSKYDRGEIINNAIVGTVIGEKGVKKTISIPFSEIKWIKYKKYSQGKTFLLAVGIGSILWATLIIIGLSSME